MWNRISQYVGDTSAFYVDLVGFCCIPFLIYYIVKIFIKKIDYKISNFLIK